MESTQTGNTAANAAPRRWPFFLMGGLLFLVGPIVVISNDDQETAQANQADFPHLVVVSDAKRKMAKAVQIIHPGAAIDGTDTNAPTTFLVDGTGTVRWTFHPDRFGDRLSPSEVLTAIDRNLQKS